MGKLTQDTTTLTSRGVRKLTQDTTTAHSPQVV
jgi:hypothetical protein